MIDKLYRETLKEIERHRDRVEWGGEEGETTSCNIPLIVKIIRNIIQLKKNQII